MAEEKGASLPSLSNAEGGDRSEWHPRKMKTSFESLSLWRLHYDLILLSLADFHRLSRYRCEEKKFDKGGWAATLQ